MILLILMCWNDNTKKIIVHPQHIKIELNNNNYKYSKNNE